MSLLKQTLASVEKKLILETLEASGGNQSRAARELGVSRTKLIYKLKQYEKEEKKS